MSTKRIEKKIKIRAANQSDATYYVYMVVLVCLLALALFVALSTGHLGISIRECLAILFKDIFGLEQTWTDMQANVIHMIRVPRALAAAMVGAGLAVSGASYQSMFKNPMVSPDILGVSSGASIGACLSILLGMGAAITQLWAFVGGLAAVLITTAIPRILRNDSPIMLVLAGIITGGLMSSALGIIRYLAMNSSSDTALEDMTFWTMGSFAKVSMDDLVSIVPVVLIAMATLFLIRYRLNVMALGDREAKTLGVNVGRTQLIIILAATLITASSVSICGTVGWVGLVVPHLCRMMVGPDNKKLIPMAMVVGALFMVVVDTLCRSIAKAEIPISIITGIVGAPFYFYLLFRQRMSMK